LTFRGAASIIFPVIHTGLIPAGMVDVSFHAGPGGLWGMRFLRKLYEYWLAFGMAIGVVVTPVQLFLIYVLVFGPARLISSIARFDPLERRPSSRPSFWTAREPRPNTLEESRHQF